MIIPGPKTRSYWSVAARPGQFGAAVFNAAFSAVEMDAIYQPFGIEDNIGGFVAALRLLKICGCGVSMPFKERIMQHMDELSEEARLIGAVNTVVNNDGLLVGHNTDIDGVSAALSSLALGQVDTVLVLGAGGVAKAAVLALSKAGIGKIMIASRHPERVCNRIAGVNVSILNWEQRSTCVASLVINATPVGMHPDEFQTPLHSDWLGQFGAVIDLVPKPTPTLMISESKAAGLPAVGGEAAALGQALRQFELYTGQPAPEEVMRKAAAALINKET